MTNSKMNCENCNGAISLPENNTELSMKCPFCGYETLIPKHILEERKRLKELEKQKIQKLEKAAADKLIRKQAIIKGIMSKGPIGLAILAALASGIWLEFGKSEHDNRPTKTPTFLSKNTGMDEAKKWVAAREAAGCDGSLSPPKLTKETMQGSISVGDTGTGCVQLLASSGQGGPKLDMQVTSPNMKQHNGGNDPMLQTLTHCGKTGGKYKITVTPSSDHPYTYAAVSCPIEKIETRTDAVSTGSAAVAARMKELYNTGCKNVVHSAKPARDDIKWTPDFPKSKRGECLVVLAATGIAENPLTIGITTPFGEVLPTPAPTTSLEYILCGETGGPHPITVTPATAAQYTFAAVGCPRRVAKKLIKKALKAEKETTR